jgi:hypothetical protein
MLTDLARQMPTHKPVYLEAQTLDLGDIQMPVVDADTGVRFVPNAAFMSDGRPLLLMIDEIGKAMRPVQNALLRVIHERKLGAYSLPAGSIVFATTNLSTDGVGDSLQAHATNRMARVRMRPPTADEWVSWAMDNGVAPEVMAWVRAYPHCLAAYTDADQADNPYIFNPRKQQFAYTSPRSLERASHIATNRHRFTPDALIAALSGTIGESAARDMQAHLAMGDALPSWERVIERPDTCPVPDSAVAQTILALGAVSRLDKAAVKPWLAYLKRLNFEVQALFTSQVIKSSKAALVITNKDFTQWCVANSFAY